MCFKAASYQVYVASPSPSTRVLTAIRASSWTPPEPAVLWNMRSRDAITTSEICRASWCCTFLSTFWRTGHTWEHTLTHTHRARRAARAWPVGWHTAGTAGRWTGSCLRCSGCETEQETEEFNYTQQNKPHPHTRLSSFRKRQESEPEPQGCSSIISPF